MGDGRWVMGDNMRMLTIGAPIYSQRPEGPNVISPLDFHTSIHTCPDWSRFSLNSPLPRSSPSPYPHFSSTPVPTGRGSA